AARANARLFADAKEASVLCINFPLAGLGGYNMQLGLNHFDLLIDWGWFYFITKPMFLALDFFYHLVGNFGVSILLVTVLVKLLFFPLANKSYASMAKMKSVQPQLAALKERYPDDKVKQQQEMMEIYKKEKINPIAGCLPVALQIPVFFTFMLAGFPAGLVIYWAWNNLLSVLQQSFIMRRNGVKVELFDNLRATFASKKAT